MKAKIKLSKIQKQAMKKIYKHKLLFLNSPPNKHNAGSFWMSFGLEDRITDSTVRRLKNFGLVEFIHSKKVFTARITELGEQVGEEI